MKWKLPKPDKKTLLIFCGVFSLLIVVNILLTSSNLSNPVIRSDGKGYYLYLPSVFIHHSLTMHWTEPMRGDGGVLFSLSAVRPGVYLDKYPIGMAILWLPFFFRSSCFKSGNWSGGKWIYHVVPGSNILCNVIVRGAWLRSTL